MTEQDLVAMRARLKELAALENGWLDGHGIAPTRENVWFCGEFLGSLVVRRDIPVPHLYPTEEGGIQAEWTFRGWEVEAVFAFNMKVIEVDAVHIATSEIDTKRWPIDGHYTEEELADFIREYM